MVLGTACTRLFCRECGASAVSVSVAPGRADAAAASASFFLTGEKTSLPSFTATHRR